MRISKLDPAAALDGDELLVISKLNASVTITAATISAQASDNSYNDSANGFVTAGFTVGKAVHVVGFTGNTVNNIFAAVVTAVTPGKLTIGGADGDVIVDDAAGESVTITQWNSVRTSVQDLADLVGSLSANPTQHVGIACSDESTALTAGAAKVSFRMPYAFTLTGVRASLTTAQTSGSIFTVDINEGGASILSTKLTVDNGEKTSTTAATPAVISDTSLADDAEITIDIDQVGDGTAKGLKVFLIGNKT